MFTAGIMMCLLGEPMNYVNCSVIQSDFRYPTEERCWDAINGQMAILPYQNHLGKFEPRYAQCVMWIQPKDDKQTF